MLLDDLWRYLARTVFIEPSTPTLFNQYADAAASLDKPNAVAIRRANFRAYVSHFVVRPKILLVGEAPGPRGCRFSGIPFTSEFQLVSRALAFTGRQSSRRPTPCKEASATILWSALDGFEAQAFIWNCVPFHPHRPGFPLSIRAPTIAEIRQYAHLLRGLVDVLRPQTVVAIGNHAARALRELGIPSVQVRHPSHGGAPVFRSSVQRILAEESVSGSSPVRRVTVPIDSPHSP